MTTELLRSIEERVRERVTPDVIAAFEADGAVCLRQLLTPAEVALIREGIDTNIAQPSPRSTAHAVLQIVPLDTIQGTLPEAYTPCTALPTRCCATTPDLHTRLHPHPICNMCACIRW